MSVPRVLDRAADAIARVGLWQGDGEGEGTCVANAISDATDSYAESQRARSVVAEYLGLDNDLGAIFRWNDTAGRTQREVVSMLRCASAFAASREPVADLTMDDLEAAAFEYGGHIEPVGDHKARLVGAFIGGRLVNLGPVLVEGASS